MPPPTPQLHRGLGLHHATAMVVGTIIGASIFVQPSEVAGRVPTLGGTALAWLAAGVVTFFGALACAELAARLPQAGGVYAYLREAFHPVFGFLWGWAMFWTMHSAIIAIVALVFARYLGFFFGYGEQGLQLVAVATILVLTAINVRGVQQGSTLQTLITAGKMLAIALMIVVGFTLGEPAAQVDVAAAPDGVTGGSWSLSDFLLAVSAGLFAYGGWHMVTYTAEETVDARSTIPKALMLGVPIVTVSYIALNAVYFYVLPIETVISSDRVAADGADAVLGSGGAAVMSALVAFSSFGALTGIVLAGPRVYYAMARDGLLFSWAAKVHPRYHTPHLALFLQAAWASVLVLTGTYRVLFTRVVYTEWIFFSLMVAGLFVLRRRGRLEDGTPMWGFPWTALLFIAASVAIVVNHIVTDPLDSLLGIGFLLLGVPVYFLWNRLAGPPTSNAETAP